MKEELEELKILINKILENIEQHIEIENIDLDEFDADYKHGNASAEDLETFYYSFRKTIVSRKNDLSFYEVDIPKLEELLSTGLSSLRSIVSESKLVDPEAYKNKPNPDIIQLIEQQILSTTTKIIGSKNGKECTGFLTDDGFLELTISGVKKKFGSLRRAVIAGWGRDVSNQWKFWMVGDKSLEYYKDQIRR